MKKSILYVFLFLAFTNWECKKDGGCNCLKGTGDVITEVRQLPTFNGVYVENDVNLIFQEDTVQRVSVEAGKNIMDGILTEMDGGILTIKNKNKCNFLRRLDIPINVYIHYVRNQFYQIRTEGTGTIANTNPCTNDSINLESEGSANITFQMGGLCRTYTHQHGAGDITLLGSCDQVIIYAKGTGFTITEDCTNNYTWVWTNTTGKTSVHSIGMLITNINGSGNVYYKGTPTSIDNTENSTGKLLPIQ